MSNGRHSLGISDDKRDGSNLPKRSANHFGRGQFALRFIRFIRFIVGTGGVVAGGLVPTHLPFLTLAFHVGYFSQSVLNMNYSTR